MGKRVQLQELLETLLGSENVYFQPPETVKLIYPCIIYSLSNIDTIFANNKPYQHYPEYLVTVIDKNPDSEIPGKVASLPMCSFDRHYKADNLNHYTYKLYF